jgi:hypothetical protein
MPEPEEPKHNGCRPAVGDTRATHQVALDCRPSVAPAEATPEALQSVQMARAVARVARVAPWRVFDPIAHHEDTARILGEAPEDAQIDAHVSDWMDWQERAAILEYDREMAGTNAKGAAGEIIRLDERRNK